MEDVKFCVDCRFVKSGDWDLKCENQFVIKEYFLPVSKIPASCISERENCDGVCGTEGKLWEKKERNRKSGELHWLLIVTAIAISIAFILGIILA